MARGPEQDTPAIVVGGLDYGEADRIVRLLSPSLGKVAVLARGARRAGPRTGRARGGLSLAPISVPYPL